MVLFVLLSNTIVYAVNRAWPWCYFAWKFLPGVFDDGALFSLFHEQERRNMLNLFMVYVEFVVGICMLAIVAWLLMFRMKDIKECWKQHHLFRYYFGLTIIGTAANLGLGICGTINANVEKTEYVRTTRTRFGRMYQTSPVRRPAQ